MNTISIRETSASEVIPRLAEEFDTPCRVDYGEYSLEIPSETGSGIITAINFPNGIGLFKFNVEFKEDHCLNFVSSIVHPFKFIYVVQGNIIHQFTTEDIKHEVDKGQSVILGASYMSGNKIVFSANQKIQVIMLSVHRKKFVNQLTFPLEEMDDVYHRIFADTNAIRTIYHHTQYSLKMAHLANELDTFKASGLERTSYHGAKALELLTYMLMLYRDDTQDVDQRTILRDKDLVKIKNVVNMIDRNIAELDNISMLAEKEQISEVKLQEGFQILFNSTVHEYIQTRRLEAAMHLLLKTEKSISEIVYAIGLNSRSHFSKIFKQKYGASPRTIRKSNSNDS